MSSDFAFSLAAAFLEQSSLSRCLRTPHASPTTSAASFVSNIGVADAQDACSEDSRARPGEAEHRGIAAGLHQRRATRSTRQARWWCYNRHDIDAMRPTGRSVLAMLALLRSARPLVPKQAVRCLARRPVKKRPTISMALCAAASHASILIHEPSRDPPSTRARAQQSAREHATAETGGAAR